MAVPGHSDVDRGGIYAADPLYLLDLIRTNPEEPSYVEKAPDPDLTLHEAKKFLRLALNGNPTVTELLWLNEYEIVTEFGARLIEIRESFLSSTRIQFGYNGYAYSQLERLFGFDHEDEVEDEVEGGRKHAEKNARHLYRILWQGIEAYKGNGIIVRLPEDVAKDARDFGEMAVQPGIKSQIQNVLDLKFGDSFDSIRSPLPQYPDNTKARQWLQDLRRSML